MERMGVIIYEQPKQACDARGLKASRHMDHRFIPLFQQNDTMTIMPHQYEPLNFWYNI